MFKSFEKTHNLNSEILNWKYYWERGNEGERSLPQDLVIYLHLPTSYWSVRLYLKIQLSIPPD